MTFAAQKLELNFHASYGQHFADVKTRRLAAWTLLNPKMGLQTNPGLNSIFHCTHCQLSSDISSFPWQHFDFLFVHYTSVIVCAMVKNWLFVKESIYLKLFKKHEWPCHICFWQHQIPGRFLIIILWVSWYFCELSGAHSSLHLRQPFAMGIPIVPWHQENHSKSKGQTWTDVFLERWRWPECSLCSFGPF